MARLALLIATVAAGCAPTPLEAPPISDGFALVRAMHEAYEGRWPRALTLTRDVTWATGDERSETWREWLMLPGRLRIEMGDPRSGIDALYARDSTFIFQDGALLQAGPTRNRLLILGSDVYAQPPAETIRQLRSEGIDLGAFRTDVWKGRPAFVAGTVERGEAWVDSQRLVLVRLREPATVGESLRDVRFERHVPLGDGWLASRVEVWTGEALVYWEDVRDVDVGTTLDPALFDPRRWGQALQER